ncbi:MAG: inositol monophosphatase [marine bacterium B5-7]|nr:MAG: inositol monophosphatase [marine bacterium B5-7]
MHAFLNTAFEAVRLASRELTRAQSRLEKLEISEKGHNDFVTDIDARVETIIIEQIKEAYPAHHFYGEELGGTLEGDHVWIIDPIDGTNNFMRGLPHFCISLALQYRGVVEHGLIYDPMRDELFTASLGRGAFLNQKRLRVTGRDKLEKALLSTGAPLYGNIEKLAHYMKSLQRLYPRCSGIRRMGSAALDLAYVAAGRLDGFWECDLKKWDVAAGALMVKEAGGLVGNYKGQQNVSNEGDIVAATPKLFLEIVKYLN